ncbi:SCP-like protein [Cooperia oncophora]
MAPTTTTTRVPAMAMTNPTSNQICPRNSVVDDVIRRKVLDMHNYRRSRTAQGMVIKNDKSYLPSAANMKQLRYDCNLEASAKLSVDRCDETPYTSLPTGVQENIYGVQKSMAPYQYNATMLAVKHWWSQVRMVDGIGADVTFRVQFLKSTIKNPTLIQSHPDHVMRKEGNGCGCCLFEPSHCRKIIFVQLREE